MEEPGSHWQWGKGHRRRADAVGGEGKHAARQFWVGGEKLVLSLLLLFLRGGEREKELRTCTWLHCATASEAPLKDSCTGVS